MTGPLLLFPERAPIGYVTVAGVRQPVFISSEFFRSLTNTVARLGGEASGSITDSELASYIRLMSAEAQEPDYMVPLVSGVESERGIEPSWPMPIMPASDDENWPPIVIQPAIDMDDFVNVSGDTMTGNLTIQKTAPSLYLDETDQAADEQLWSWQLNGKVLSFRTLSDDEITTRDYMTITRGTGTAISSISYGNATNNPGHKFSGRIGIGSSAALAANTALKLRGNTVTDFGMSSAFNYQIWASATYASTTTSEGYAFIAEGHGTEAAPFTLTSLGGFRCDNAILGAGSTITNQYGLLINDLTVAANNYGISCQVSSGTNKWNIYASGTARNYFAGAILIAEQSATPSNPTAGTECNFYMKSDKFVIQYNDAGTVRYKYLDLTGTGVTWVHDTVAP